MIYLYPCSKGFFTCKYFRVRVFLEYNVQYSEHNPIYYICTNTLYSICYLGTVASHMDTIFGMFPAYVSGVFSRTGSGSSMYIYASVATPFQKFQEFTARRACQPAAYAPWSRRCLLRTLADGHIGVPRVEYRGPATPGRVRTGESREGTHSHFVFQVYISPAPKPSK